MSWFSDLFQNQESEQTEVKTHREIKANAWFSELEKEAAYEMGEKPEETINKDYELRVQGLSNYNLAEMLAEKICQQDQTNTVNFNDEKATQLKAVESNRGSSEKKLLKLIGEHTSLDWKAAFTRFEKAEVVHADEKDIHGVTPEVSKKQEWEKKVNFKAPSDKERVKVQMDGVGKEEDKNAIGNEKLLEEQRKEASLNKKASNPEYLYVSEDFHVWSVYGARGKNGWSLGFEFPSKEEALALAQVISQKLGIPINEKEASLKTARNMDYVQFENTYGDLQSCGFAWDEGLSKSESEYRVRLKQLCVELAERPIPEEGGDDMGEHLPPVDSIDTGASKKAPQKRAEEIDEEVGSEVGSPEWLKKTLIDANDYFQHMNIIPVEVDLINYIASAIEFETEIEGEEAHRRAESLFNQHLEASLKEGSHTCPTCDKVIADPSDYAQHQSTHTQKEVPAKEQKCPYCAEVFHNWAAYNQHRKTHSGPKEASYGDSRYMKVERELKTLLESGVGRKLTPEELSKKERLEKELGDLSKKQASLKKEAFRRGDRLFYRGHPCIIRDIEINPFSYETVVHILCENTKVTLDKKELKQLSTKPLEVTEEPVKPTPEVVPPVATPEAYPVEGAKKEAITKKAEIDSPWKLIKDKDGKDVIARVQPGSNNKESKNDEVEVTKAASLKKADSAWKSNQAVRTGLDVFIPEEIWQNSVADAIEFLLEEKSPDYVAPHVYSSTIGAPEGAIKGRTLQFMDEGSLLETFETPGTVDIPLVSAEALSVEEATEIMQGKTPPKGKDLDLEKIPTLNLKKKRDELLDQLNKETDPTKKEQIKERLKSLAYLSFKMSKVGMQKKEATSKCKNCGAVGNVGWYVDQQGDRAVICPKCAEDLGAKKEAAPKKPESFPSILEKNPELKSKVDSVTPETLEVVKKELTEYISSTRINDEDKKKMVVTISQIKDPTKLIFYFYNSILKYRGLGV